MGEYAIRTSTDGSPVVSAEVSEDGVPTVISAKYYTGSAYNLMVGYLLYSNWEIAGRLTHIEPEKIISVPQDQYGLAISKYIVGHNLKVQTDVNLLQVDGAKDVLMFRLQTEFAF